MWHTATYRPVTLFSLRPANSTTSGGKTLVSPTPYAVKMALLNAAFRVNTLETDEDAAHLFEDHLRDLEVAVHLPEAMIVIGTFQRILRPAPKSRQTDPLGTGLDATWQNNIAFREYVFFEPTDSLTVAVRHPDGSDLDWPRLFSQINYFGKRGSFMQFIAYKGTDYLPANFTRLNPVETDRIELRGLLQLMDDCGPEMTWAHANIYDKKRLSVDRTNGRLLNTVVLPYEMATTARGFTMYQRIREDT